MRRLMLQQCSDEHRFQITAKLCEDVLGGVADGTLLLGPSQGVLGERNAAIFPTIPTARVVLAWCRVEWVTALGCAG